MKKILITGATGLIGSALTHLLQQNGPPPLLLARTPPSTEQQVALGIDLEQFIQGDISAPRLGLSATNYDTLRQSIDTIFHLAARVDFKGRALKEYLPTNVEGTRQVIQLARESGAMLHYASTAFVCGSATTFREDELAVGQSFRNGYEESKFLAEQAVHEFLQHCPGQAAIYRLAIILGRGSAASQDTAFGPFFFMDAVFRMLLSDRRENDTAPLRILGSPQAHLPMLFADQAAQAMVSLAKSCPGGRTFHLVPKSSLPNSRLETLFNQAFGRQVVRWSSTQDFADLPASRRENILAKKTAMYADYLHLQLQHDRSHLEEVLGPDVLPCPDEDEFFTAFTDFLAAKNSAIPAPVALPRRTLADDYFEHFLLRFQGRQLLQNLISLTADFWIELDGTHSWSIRINQGRLESVHKTTKDGNFGYRTDTQTYLRIVGAEISPQEGFFRGAIKLSGNSREALRTASALEEFFSNFPYCPGAQHPLPATAL